MAKSIILSLNELRALLRKAFEGLYGHNRDWNAMTEQVMWLEFHGLQGVSKFLAAASELADCKFAFLETEQELRFDGDGASLLGAGHRICDLILARTISKGPQKVHIINAETPETMMASVARLARHGFAASAWWGNGKGRVFLAWQDKDDNYPCLFQVKAPAEFEEFNHITVLTHNNLSQIKAEYPLWFNCLEGGARPADAISQSYLNHLDNGFPISQSEYNQLCELADKILVEATEQSRQGAGE